MPNTLRFFTTDEVYGMIGDIGSEGKKRKPPRRVKGKVKREQANSKRRRVRRLESAIRNIRISDLTTTKAIDLTMGLIGKHGATPGEELANELCKLLSN